MRRLAIIVFFLLAQIANAQTDMVRHLQVIGKTGDENPLNSIALVSAYDYAASQTLQETPFDSSADTTLRYIYLSADSSSFAITEAETLKDLLSSLSKWKDLLVLVHGYGDNITRLANREPLLVDMYNYDVLVFCWPAMIEAGSKVKNYAATKDSIEAAMPLFERFLDELRPYVRENRIHCSMMFHSLGNRFAMLLGEKLSQNSKYCDLSFIGNIVLNEACVPLPGYMEWAEPLSDAIIGRLAITYNKNDIVLAIARSFSEKQPLLGQGPTIKHPFTITPKIRYIDFTQTLRWQDPHFSHNFYVRHPKEKPEKSREIVSTYRMIL